MIDLRWMSSGGLLGDGAGDIQLTDPSIPESLMDMIFTRLKADVNSWQIYRIGANLSYLIGESFSRGQAQEQELELRIKRQISASLTFDGLLRLSDFSVETIPSENTITAIVYLSSVAVATVSVPREPGAEVFVQ